MSEYDLFQFIFGMSACRNGYIPTGNESESWTRGFAAEYQIEENNSNMVELSWA